MRRVRAAIDQSSAPARLGLLPTLEPPWERHWHGSFALPLDRCGAAAYEGNRCRALRRAPAAGCGVALSVAARQTVLPAAHADTNLIRPPQWGNVREPRHRRLPVLPGANSRLR